MTPAQGIGIAGVFVAIAVTPACRKPVLEPVRPGDALVVLLPDADSGSTGRAVVSSSSASVDLDSARDATLTRTGRRPGPVRTVSEADVERLFGEALSALPPTARHFTLYFQFESDELTEESREMMREILSAVKERAMPEVAVVGHTDTLGAPAANYELGLKRASTVRNLLVAAGLDMSLTDVRSHGEGDPIIKTADETPEPGNRRVEITVR